MDCDDNVSVESSFQQVEPSQASVEASASNASNKRRARSDRSRSVSTLASEKDPRMRHNNTRSSMSRRPSLCRGYGTRTGFSSGTIISVQLPPVHTLEDIDLEEQAAESVAQTFEDCDKYGNKRLSAAYHSRRSSRGSTASSSSRSSSVAYSEPQPGAYYTSKGTIVRSTLMLNLVILLFNRMIPTPED